MLPFELYSSRNYIFFYINFGYINKGSNANLYSLVQRFAPQRFAPRAPAFQAPRFTSRPAAAPVSAPTFGRFSGTFFRPNTPLHEPKKVPVEVPTATVVKGNAAADVMPVADADALTRAAAANPVAAPVVAAAAKPKGNYQWNGSSYLLTWRTGRNNFAWNDGVAYCKSKVNQTIKFAKNHCLKDCV